MKEKVQHVIYDNKLEEVYFNNKWQLHRTDGPAVTIYDVNTRNIIKERYYLNNKEYDVFSYYVKTKKSK